uniref:Uncharacterized protein n=1 Tax=Timema shepardi TaxID=629360 RepID=A0A7R9ALU6_TIMSH|nr:unnamed protein product [Timema shepardi]
MKSLGCILYAMCYFKSPFDSVYECGDSVALAVISGNVKFPENSPYDQRVMFLTQALKREKEEILQIIKSVLVSFGTNRHWKVPNSSTALPRERPNQEVVLPDKPAYSGKVPMNETKIKDIRKLIQYVPVEYQEFYNEILQWPEMHNLIMYMLKVNPMERPYIYSVIEKTHDVMLKLQAQEGEWVESPVGRAEQQQVGTVERVVGGPSLERKLSQIIKGPGNEESYVYRKCTSIWMESEKLWGGDSVHPTEIRTSISSLSEVWSTARVARKEIPVCHKAFLSIQGVSKHIVGRLHQSLVMTGQSPKDERCRHDNRTGKCCAVFKVVEAVFLCKNDQNQQRRNVLEFAWTENRVPFRRITTSVIPASFRIKSDEVDALAREPSVVGDLTTVRCTTYSSPMDSLVLTDSSQLTPDSQHLETRFHSQEKRRKHTPLSPHSLADDKPDRYVFNQVVVSSCSRGLPCNVGVWGNSIGLLIYVEELKTETRTRKYRLGPISNLLTGKRLWLARSKSSTGWLILFSGPRQFEWREDKPTVTTGRLTLVSSAKALFFSDYLTYRHALWAGLPLPSHSVWNFRWVRQATTGLDAASYLPTLLIQYCQPCKGCPEGFLELDI